MTEPSQYLYRLQLNDPGLLDRDPTPAETVILENHFDYLRSLAEQGTVFLAGRTLAKGADAFGIVILETSSADTARQIMTADPAVREGLMNAVLYPFRTALRGRTPT